MIYAVNLNARELSGIPDQHHGVTIKKLIREITQGELPVARADGILIANALHFVADQPALLTRLQRATKKLLVVEYEKKMPSPWGPYPVNDAKFHPPAS